MGQNNPHPVVKNSPTLVLHSTSSSPQIRIPDGSRNDRAGPDVNHSRWIQNESDLIILDSHSLILVPPRHKKRLTSPITGTSAFVPPVGFRRLRVDLAGFYGRGLAATIVADCRGCNSWFTDMLWTPPWAKRMVTLPVYPCFDRVCNVCSAHCNVGLSSSFIVFLPWPLALRRAADRRTQNNIRM